VREKRRIKFIKKKKIGEKDDEWEMKNQGCWPPPTPHLSVFHLSLSLSMGIVFCQGEKYSPRDNFIITRDC
jgi:hypothetical protein